eukprot:CAMPEP_0181214428 /NCGR_PEP_ID=MMETSP1096-20121128/25448_1 /TAXON_ID=156174 ORGANISM="Chrysochromulina ericina, Strain CCMP281" /NCGR_SAMPLE_ID=MMETSP1096 /ASSEMBLY_ACC=CAM_ASM_000453 /LENGTH=59 /DNA_ID=CAMNT_0023306163 /DNA_START=274 /DNA_END=453 /DNA_ORIENTATION=-
MAPPIPSITAAGDLRAFVPRQICMYGAVLLHNANGHCQCAESILQREPHARIDASEPRR